MTTILENDFLKIRIQSTGAELVSLQTKNNNLEYIWQADPQIWARHAPVLFPVVGKLRNNSFRFDGKTYNLAQHGFARDKAFNIIKNDKLTASLQLEADEDTLKIFPFPFKLTTNYQLVKNGVRITYHVENPESSPLYFSIGAHPGFNCPLINEDFSDYFLEFEKSEDFFRYKIKDGLLSGEKEKIVSDGNIINLSSRLFKEDALVFKHLKSNYVILKNRLNDHQVKVSMEGFPFLGVWTKPSDKPSFVCIEPWLGIADNHQSEGNLINKEGIIKLEGYQKYTCDYSIYVH